MSINQFTSPEGDLDNYLITEYWLIDQWVGDTLWTWGAGNSGRLGTNDATNRLTPVTTFAGGTNWKQVTLTSGMTATAAAIKTDGTLWTWGINFVSQLGDNTSVFSVLTPVTTFAGGTNWKQISNGSFNAAAIKTDGTLWTWGYGGYGALGDNTSVFSVLTPITTFAGGTNWKQVACGFHYTAAIKTDGTLWTWGDNAYGKLGDNTITRRCTPVTTFAGGTNWKQVSGGQFHIAAIKTDGTLWTWGLNSYGRLGDNTTTQRNTPVTTFAGGTNWKQVSAGSDYVAAIKTDGTLWTWGRNYGGRLGDNTNLDKLTPVTTFAGGTNWKQVAGGYNHTAAIKTDGTLWTWGINSTGQIGDNTIIDRSTPVTTFAGGTNWKKVACVETVTIAVTSGTDPTFFIS